MTMMATSVATWSMLIQPAKAQTTNPNAPHVAQVRGIYARLSFGETREILRNGTIAVEAKCIFNGGEGNPGQFNHLLVLLAKSDQHGALFRGEGESLPDAFSGNNEYLGPVTLETKRRISFQNFGQAGSPHFGARSGLGVIVGTKGEVIILQGTTGEFGFEVAGADCLLVDQATVFDGR
jgi:hypothetical protein